MPSGVARGIGIIASCGRRQTDADWLAQNKPGMAATGHQLKHPVVLTPAGVPCRAAVGARAGVLLLFPWRKTTVDRWRRGS